MKQILIPILQMTKVRFKEILKKRFVQGHTASKQKYQDQTHV